MTRVLISSMGLMVLTGTAVILIGVARDRTDMSLLGLGIAAVAALFGTTAILASGRSGKIRLSVRRGRIDLQSVVNAKIEERSSVSRQRVTRDGATHERGRS